MQDYWISLLTAGWLGFLCAISPCPLATNVAAIGFISRKVGEVRAVIVAGFLYTVGRTLAYTALGFLLVQGLTAAPHLSHVLQKYLNIFMGPLLILVAMFMLKLFNFSPSKGASLGARFHHQIEKLGVLSSFFLGILFALSFCPSSAALFWGALLPIAIQQESSLVIPLVFGVMTALPVFVFAGLLAISANKVAKAYKALTSCEYWAQQLTGILFLAIGLYMTFSITLGIDWH